MAAARAPRQSAVRARFDELFPTASDFDQPLPPADCPARAVLLRESALIHLDGARHVYAYRGTPAPIPLASVSHLMDEQGVDVWADNEPNIVRGVMRAHRTCEARARQYLENRRERGTVTHQLIEEFLDSLVGGGRANDCPELFEHAYADLIADRFFLVGTEVKLYDPGRKLAGTVDLIVSPWQQYSAYLRDTAQGVERALPVVLLDWKCSRMRASLRYHHQLNLYRQLAIANGLEVLAMYDVFLEDDGAYKARPVHIDNSSFTWRVRSIPQ